MKTYESLYYSYTHIVGKENTRLHKFWKNFWGFWHFLVIRKLQGFIRFQISLGIKNEKLCIIVFSYFPGNYKDT